MEIILLTIIVLIIIDFIIFNTQYQKSNYKKFTNKNRIVIRYNLTLYRKFKVFKKLEVSFQNLKLLFNVTIPKKYNKKVQFDIIGIHKTGIYFFDLKDINGVIVGDNECKLWKFFLKNGKENEFQNPLWKNYQKLKDLSEFLNVSLKNLESIVVFNKKCTIEKVDHVYTDTIITKENYLIEELTKKIKYGNNSFNPIETMEYYNALLEYTNEISIDQSVIKEQVK